MPLRLIIHHIYTVLVSILDELAILIGWIFEIIVGLIPTFYGSLHRTSWGDYKIRKTFRK